MTDDAVLHDEPVITHRGNARADGDGVRVGEGFAKSRFGGRQDGADAAIGIEIGPAKPAKILHPATFKIAKVHHIIDMAIGIHLAPNDGQFDHDGEPG